LKFGAYPLSLDDLNEAESREGIEGKSQNLDGWKRPFLYQSNGTNYLIMSYGRDGKPGGKDSIVI